MQLNTTVLTQQCLFVLPVGYGTVPVLFAVNNHFVIIIRINIDNNNMIGNLMDETSIHKVVSYIQATNYKWVARLIHLKCSYTEYLYVNAHIVYFIHLIPYFNLFVYDKQDDFDFKSVHVSLLG